MVKEINKYLNQIGQDDSLTVNSSDSSSSGAKKENKSYVSIVSIYLFFMYLFSPYVCFLLLPCQIYV